METSLCAFKKFFRKRQGRYAGFYLDRQAEEIRKVESDGWNGVNWELCWDYRKECLIPELAPRDAKVNPKRMETFLDTGDIPELRMFKDLT